MSEADATMADMAAGPELATDAPASDAGPNGAAASGPSVLDQLGGVVSFLKQGDLGLALGVMTILMVMILPMPGALLDMFLALSIIFSVLILMTALFIRAPLEFSAFPTVLLVATMLRLALNLASTRLILSYGHEGSALRAM